MMGNHFKAKCKACGYVWIIAFLPMPGDKMRHFTKWVCPKCFDKKPMMASEHDPTEAERLRKLLLRSYHALTGRFTKTAELAWDDLLADMKAEIENG